MKKGKKGLALAMTLAVTMTSVPTAFALDGNAQPTKQPDKSVGSERYKSDFLQVYKAGSGTNEGKCAGKL